MSSDPVPAATQAVHAFIVAATVPREGAHAAGTLDLANEMLAARPEVAAANIHTAAILGDASGVRGWLARDPGAATVRGGPRDWDALTHLCFSRYLRLDPARSTGFVDAAAALLDGGANPNTGFWEHDHQPAPILESVLYGACGVAHHAPLTRLLIERGADPNDEEVVYHAPETCDNEAMRILVGSGGLSGASLTTLLTRKHDWHDAEGVRWLLEHGADPNAVSPWGSTPLQHAIRRDNARDVVALLLDHGADPTIAAGAAAAVPLAARRGRADLLALFASRGFAGAIDGLHGVDGLAAACAAGDVAAIRAIASRDPALVSELVAGGGRTLAEFAGSGNAGGVARLLDLGVPVDARFAEGDGYWNVAKESTALHVAAWRARHDVVALLIARGASVHATDGLGRTPLALAVRAAVDSYWKAARAPDSVAALLNAGASAASVGYPSGYEAIDELLRRRGGHA